MFNRSPIGEPASLQMLDASYRAIWENATIGIYRSSPDGRRLHANPALVRLNGYASEAEMLAAVSDIAAEWYVDPDRRADFMHELETRGFVEDFRSEVFRHRTRERIWVSENAWVVRSDEGRTLYFEGTVSDITVQVRTLHALQESEERFRDFADTASDWYWETGPDHRFTYMSDRIRAFGVEPAARIGKRRIDMMADPADPRWQNHLQTLERHEPFRNFTYHMKLGDEAPHHLCVSGKPIFAPDGTFRGYRGSAREVTEQVEAEEKLQQALRQADAANRAKTDFLANMSHELRTPLNAIIGFAEVMKDELLSPDRYPEYARHIHDSGVHLLALINEILDMSKIAAGKMTLEPEAVAPANAVDRAAAMVAMRAERSNIRLTTMVEENLPALRADPVRLGQILLNLLSNAVKFTSPGGTVTLACRRAGVDQLLIEVADTGIGMAPEEVHLALQPFARVQQSNGRRYEGTGLGLSITRSLVELHGGSLEIRSERERGTVARVLLPLEVECLAVG
ncbi:sensor histidine kinase [Arenibaculum sp.]|jgi:PAS domain S-box-containing protein|uniref:sensor histidine kinase n=1 Tax=Arenibaculum sp. TaxID=2865862 RepID=UPI002E167417|nr:ATP-binding protein [Arenibaculum sp.]